MPAEIPRKDSKSLMDIDELRQGILCGKRHYNNIVTLLDLLDSNDGYTVDKAAVALAKIFIKLIPNLKEINEIDRWLKQRYVEYVDRLCNMLVHDDIGLQKSAATLLLRLAKDIGISPVFSKFVRATLKQETSHDVLLLLAENLVFIDLRIQFLTATKQAAVSRLEPLSIVTQNAITILLHSSFNESDQNLWCTPGTNTNMAYGNVFQQCWLALLQLPLNSEQYKAVLVVMHKRIILHMPKPQLLMDFLTDSYNLGGKNALLALNGLFYLMQKHNLDYPNFFPKLYACFTLELMRAEYRSRFLRLADIFLSSTHLPAALVASFIKRMSRLALQSPPDAIVAIIPFIYNLLKRHLPCMALLHRENSSKGVKDAFDPHEPDPLKTNAIESSLWELETLQSHFHPNVSTLAKIISEKFTKPTYNMEDFLDYSYVTMLDAEFLRKPKGTPQLEFETPNDLFGTFNKDTGENLIGSPFLQIFTYE